MVVLAIPLLTALHRETVRLDKVVVVDCPTDVALERLLDQRGIDRADAEARIARPDHPGGAGQGGRLRAGQLGRPGPLEAEVAGCGSGSRAARR